MQGDGKANKSSQLWKSRDRFHPGVQIDSRMDLMPRQSDNVVIRHSTEGKNRKIVSHLFWHAGGFTGESNYGGKS